MSEQKPEQNTPPESQEPPQPPEGQTPPEGTPGGQQPTGEPETFPRAYVEELRRENADNRVKAKRADALTQRLVAELARATGRMADPTDLPVTDALLDEQGIPDPVKVDAAVTALLGAKPHLASRRPRGDVGQGNRGEAGGVDLAGLLRAHAG